MVTYAVNGQGIASGLWQWQAETFTKEICYLMHVSTGLSPSS